MPASKSTLDQIIKILKEEIGLERAQKIAHRLATETQGNDSYSRTVGSLYQKLKGE